MKSRSSRNTSMANSSRKRSIKPALKKLEGASGGEFDRMYMV
jgi:hypothetical protein